MCMPISNNYYHTVQYHETDSMKIVHHANYVKWMEEARLEFFRHAGFDWAYMEKEFGIMIPVLFQSVEYRKAIRFDEEVEVRCVCDKFNGVKMNYSYEFVSADHTLLAAGITRHGFVNAEFEPAMLQNTYTEGYTALSNAVKNQKIKDSGKREQG